MNKPLIFAISVTLLILTSLFLRDPEVSGNAFAYTKCVDSDGGKNPVQSTKLGIVTKDYKVTPDKCTSNTILSESTCDSKGAVKIASIDCSKTGQICFNGLCLAKNVNYKESTVMSAKNKDKFLLTKFNEPPSVPPKSFFGSRILRFSELDSVKKVIIFTDENGLSIVSPFDKAGEGNIKIDNNNFKFKIESQDLKTIKIDLNGDGKIK